MISTCSYNNFETDAFRGVSISGDRGRGANFEGEAYPSLAPKKSFWDIWHNNIGKISEAENLKYYATEYYNHVLSKLDPEKVFDELDNSVLLCYEEPELFCHRDIVAAWFKLFLGIDIPEVKIVGYRSITQKRFDMTNILEEVIRENTNLKGFESLRAYFLFEKANRYDDKALEEEKKGHDASNIRQFAAFLRSDADITEEEYKYIKNQKKKVKNGY